MTGGRPRKVYPDGKKYCNLCNTEKNLDEFGLQSDRQTWKRRANCKSCCRVYGARSHRTWIGWAKSALSNCKRRARSRGLPCLLTQKDLLDLLPPDLLCPVFRTPLERGDGQSSPNSPSVDEIVPGQGYTKDNVVVVSNRANTLKSNMTLEDMERMVDFYERVSNAFQGCEDPA